MFKCIFMNFAKHTIIINGAAKPQKNWTKCISTTTTRSTNENELNTARKPDEGMQLIGNIEFHKFTAEEQQKILEVLNNDKLEDIINYDIAKTRAAKLLSWKKRNGRFKSIEDIFMIDGFGAKIVEKFYKSMFPEYSDKTKAKNIGLRQRVSAFITPVIDADHRQELRSCTAIRVGVTSVTWARLELPETLNHDVPLSLTHWQHHEINEKKLHLSELINQLLYIDHLIPNADIYIFEDPPIAQMNSNPGSVDQQNVNIQKSQVIAMLAYTLRKRSPYMQVKDGSMLDDNKKPVAYNRLNVCYLRRFLTARLFNHLVGTERVSSEEAILQLMRTHYNAELLQHIADDDESDSSQYATKGAKETREPSVQSKSSFRGKVKFTMAQREMFSDAQRYHREFLGQSLLLNLAFMRLVVLQDERSIATVTRHHSKANTEELSC